jgi:hypothetical protein
VYVGTKTCAEVCVLLVVVGGRGRGRGFLVIIMVLAQYFLNFSPFLTVSQIASYMGANMSAAQQVQEEAEAEKKKVAKKKSAKP